MTEIGFNRKPFGRTLYTEDGKVCRSPSDCAFEPVVVFKPGIEAIIEGLRLSNVKSLPTPRRSFDAGDIDA